MVVYGRKRSAGNLHMHVEGIFLVALSKADAVGVEKHEVGCSDRGPMQSSL